MLWNSSQAYFQNNTVIALAKTAVNMLMHFCMRMKDSDNLDGDIAFGCNPNQDLDI